MKLKCTELGSFHSVVMPILKYWNSRTFKDLLHQIPKNSRPYSIFKDFPGPGKMEKKFFKDFQGRVATLYLVWPELGLGLGLVFKRLNW